MKPHAQYTVDQYQKQWVPWKAIFQNQYKDNLKLASYKIYGGHWTVNFRGSNDMTVCRRKVNDAREKVIHRQGHCILG